MITRRRFLQLAAGGFAYVAAGIKPAASASYHVGIGNSVDPYEATLRAVEASGEWPSAIIEGKTVVIKPNLVAPLASVTGATTDPEVVRALVDLSLEGGASQILIVEGGLNSANFSACGYDYFSGYDSRVRLIDLNQEPLTVVQVRGGLAYQYCYFPEVLLSEDLIFISVGKLKTHSTTCATLSVKNAVGLAPTSRYYHSSRDFLGLGAMHLRGINQAIVDVNLLRPSDFALVDGVWAMEGNGPTSGDPVSMEMVVAGRNAVAVDRVCLWAMSFSQAAVQHLTYAARKGLGPDGLGEIEIVGDPVSQRVFRWPTGLPPIIEYPRALPFSFNPGDGQKTLILYTTGRSCATRLDIIRTSELSPLFVHVRTVHDWESVSSGLRLHQWDGRDDSGNLVPPGHYNMWVQAAYRKNGRVAYGTGWVRVVSS